MKYELTDAQATTLLVMLENSPVKGADAEYVVDLKRALKSPVVEAPMEVVNEGKDKK